MSTDDGPAPGVPAPLTHVLLITLALLPLVVPVPTNANIVLTAAAAVLCGSWRSIKPEPPTETMTQKDAMKFPLLGSAMLFSLFLAFKFLPKDLVNLVLSLYIVLLGMLSLVATMHPLLAPLVPRLAHAGFTLRLPRIPYFLPGGASTTITALEGVLALPAAIFCWWYWSTKHWAGNNALGLAFSLQGVEHLSLGTVQNGVILLAGLFVYDVFWVFCTPVMVSVAKSFDAPIKLLFPRFPAAHGAAQFSMLGLGDIVIPGIFVALVLRYDHAHGSGRPRLFYSAFAGYVAGLAGTIVVMNVFKAAQPALLYIVPAVLATTFGHAAKGGESQALLLWQEGGETKAAADGKEEAAADGKEEAAADGKGEAADGVAAVTPQKAGPEGEAAGEGTLRVTRSAAKAAKNKDA